jgi:quinol monooxygenase YgiN
MRAKPGKEQDLRDALEALIEPTSQEEGYVNYDLHQGIEDSSLFYLYENWESVDTHETHMHTPASGGFRRQARRSARWQSDRRTGAADRLKPCTRR